FMLIGLIFRGVAFEFRFKASEHWRHVWDKAFIGGSLVATFAQGVVLGAFIDGLAVEDDQFAGGSLDWLAPFPIFCGFGLVAAYALLGSTGLSIRTEGPLPERKHYLARPAAPGRLAALRGVRVCIPS